MRKHANTDIVEWSANGSSPPRQKPPEPRGREQAESPRSPRSASRASPVGRGTPSRASARARRTKLIAGAGRRDGLEPKDLISAIVDHSRLEGEDVHNVRVLERFSFAEVPADRAEEVVTKLNEKVDYDLEVAKR